MEVGDLKWLADREIKNTLRKIDNTFKDWK